MRTLYNNFLGFLYQLQIRLLKTQGDYQQQRNYSYQTALLLIASNHPIVHNLVKYSLNYNYHATLTFFINQKIKMQS